MPCEGCVDPSQSIERVSIKRDIYLSKTKQV